MQLFKNDTLLFFTLTCAGCHTVIDLTGTTATASATDTGSGFGTTDAGASTSSTAHPEPATNSTGDGSGTTAPPLETGTGVDTGDDIAPGEFDAVQISVDSHTCVALSNGQAQCWGTNGYGQLGVGNTTWDVSLHPAEFGPVTLGEKIVSITVGHYFACALRQSGSVQCWGHNDVGQLGVGHTNDIGDDELPVDEAAVALPAAAVQVVAGYDHACALLNDGTVRCWGSNAYGALGTGKPGAIGDDESVLAGDDVALPWAAVDITAGNHGTCARSKEGKVRCWGISRILGLGMSPENLPALGDNEKVIVAPDIDVGWPVKKIVVHDHTCVVGYAGELKCWGENASGELGQGNTDNVGYTNTPAEVPDIDLGWPVGDVAVGGEYSIGNWTLAVSQDGQHLRSFGTGKNGVLGLGKSVQIGDDELPTAATEVVITVPIVQLEAGDFHSCVRTGTGADVYCWGTNGGFSYGNPFTIGDDEDPIWAGTVLYH